MAYELELPRDVETDIEEFLARFSSEARTIARNAIVGELVKLEINPKLGYAYFGGPSERRLFYRFRIEVESVIYHLQLAYRITEAKKLVTAHGFTEYDPPE
jgi:hypothetical protein